MGRILGKGGFSIRGYPENKGFRGELESEDFIVLRAQK